MGALLLAALVLSGAVSAAGSEGPDVSGLQVDPASALAVGSPLGAAGKTVNAVVRLTDAPLAVAYKQAGGMTKEQQQTYVRGLRAKQDALLFAPQSRRSRARKAGNLRLTPLCSRGNQGSEVETRAPKWPCRTRRLSSATRR